MRDLAKETGISRHILKKVFGAYGLPSLTQAEGVRENWKDPRFRARNAEGVRENWKDPRFRARQAEGVRRARLDPENIGKYYLPTIHGYRSDIGLDAQSTWEANFARVLVYCGREFYSGEVFRLRVPEEHRELFNSDETEMRIDYVVRDNRGNLVLYEIMAHPLKDPIGYVKLEMLMNQYPADIRIIDGKFYRRLKRHFEGRINNFEGLAGWETSRDNLRTSPGKYGETASS